MRNPFRKQIPQKLRQVPRAWIMTDIGNAVPLAILKQSEFRKESQKIHEEDAAWAGNSGLISMPYAPFSFLFMYESSGSFANCVNQIALDVAGTGHTLNLKEGAAENNGQKDRILEFIDKPNDDLSFEDINERMLIDWGVLGRFTLEVARNPAGQVKEVHHLKAASIWHHKDRNKFAQKAGIKATWFAKFGYTKNGDLLSLDKKTGAEKPLSLSDEDRAHELIAYDRYYPLSVYGMPKILPATGDLMTSLGIRDFNLIFFQNYGIPAYLIKLEGDWGTQGGEEEGESDAVKLIEEYFRTHVKGADNSHKAMTIQIPHDCSMTVEPLSVDIKEGSFRVLKKMSDDAILEAYSMPPYRIGRPVVGSLGGQIVPELNENYNSGVVEPLQRVTERIWNKLVFPSLFSEEGEEISYELKWSNIDFTDEKAQAEQFNAAIEHGWMTPNEVRRERGQEEYPEGDQFYMMSNLVPVGEDWDEENAKSHD